MLRVVIVALVLAGCSSSSKTPAGAPGEHGHRHRGLSRGGTCDPTPRPPGDADRSLEGCHADSECRDGKNGRCNASRGGQYDENECEYDQCVADSDCSGGVCFCQDRGNYCVPANCKRDADCAVGPCSPTHGCRASLSGYYCHTATDDCRTSDECRAKDRDSICDYSVELARWTCVTRDCPDG